MFTTSIFYAGFAFGILFGGAFGAIVMAIFCGGSRHNK